MLPIGRKRPYCTVLYSHNIRGCLEGHSLLRQPIITMSLMETTKYSSYSTA